MNCDFEYTVTYENGETRSSKNPSSAQLTMEQYARLARAVKVNPQLDDRTDIADIIAVFQDTVRREDQWYAKNGSLRTSRLKHPRPIASIALRLRQRELDRIRKYPDNLLDLEESSMTIVGSNGEAYTIESWFGEVRISHGSATSILDADQFINRILFR